RHLARIQFGRYRAVGLAGALGEDGPPLKRSLVACILIYTLEPRGRTAVQADTSGCPIWKQVRPHGLWPPRSPSSGHQGQVGPSSRHSSPPPPPAARTDQSLRQRKANLPLSRHR